MEREREQARLQNNHYCVGSWNEKGDASSRLWLANREQRESENEPVQDFTMASDRALRKSELQSNTSSTEKSVE